MLRPSCLCGFVASAVVTATTALATPGGAWLQGPDRIPLALVDRTYVPEFHVVKTAVFSNNGTPKASHPHAQYRLTCGREAALESHAWVTHRLSAGERLSPEAGRKLGTELTKLLKETCLSAVELDVEPMPAPPEWLVPFLKAVRATLVSDYELRLAIPPVTAAPLRGLSWRPADALRVLEAVDGLDLMLYDSGASDAAAYEKIVAEAFGFAAAVSTGKRLVLGLPAYKDKHKPLHPLDVENLSVAQTALGKLSKDKARLLCDGRARLAYYAHWTMDVNDRLLAKKIGEWKENICR